MSLLQQLRTTLCYLSIYFPCQLRYFLYHVTSLFVPPSKKLTVKPLSRCCAASFVGHSSESGLPKMSLCAATSDFGERSTLPESLALELFAHPLLSLPWKFVVPFFKQPTPFLHTPHQTLEQYGYEYPPDEHF